MKRNDRGTPQGGVLSPLLANVYLHWFEHLFERADGPSQWARTKLVRYADDLVLMARYIGPRLKEWIEGKLEGWLKLKISREKTRVVQAVDPREYLDFRGYRFRYDQALHGRPWRYWHLEPSPKAMEKERQALRQLTDGRQCKTPVSELIGRINRHRRGWANYFRLGHPRRAFRNLNRFVDERLYGHLRRRSQRPSRPPADVSVYAYLRTLGLQPL